MLFWLHQGRNFIRLLFVKVLVLLRGKNREAVLRKNFKIVLQFLFRLPCLALLKFHLLCFLLLVFFRHHTSRKIMMLLVFLGLAIIVTHMALNSSYRGSLFFFWPFLCVAPFSSKRVSEGQEARNLLVFFFLVSKRWLRKGVKIEVKI